MMKFNEILEEIKRTTTAIEAAEAMDKKLSSEYVNEPDLMTRVAKCKNLEAKMIANSEKKKDLAITRKILKSNARVALYHEVIPVALEVLAKYRGKPYGEKTRDKISKEVYEKTGCRLYIDCRYSSHSLEIYPHNAPGNDYNLSCGTVYAGGQFRPLLVDNKIQPILLDEIVLRYVPTEYVEDIPARVEELKNLYQEAVKARDELKAICDKYNNLAGDLPHIYADHHIYSQMEV